MCRAVGCSALNEQAAVLPRRRVLPSLSFIGEQNTRTRIRGVPESRLVLYGGYVNGVPPSMC